MASMTGTFSAAVQAQIDGQSTAPLANQTPRPSGTGAPSGSASITASRTGSQSASRTGSATGAGATSSGAANGAVNVKAGWVGALLTALVGASML